MNFGLSEIDYIRNMSDVEKERMRAYEESLETRDNEIRNKYNFSPNANCSTCSHVCFIPETTDTNICGRWTERQESL